MNKILLLFFLSVLSVNLSVLNVKSSSQLDSSQSNVYGHFNAGADRTRCTLLKDELIGKLYSFKNFVIPFGFGNVENYIIKSFSAEVLRLCKPEQKLTELSTIHDAMENKVKSAHYLMGDYDEKIKEIMTERGKIQIDGSEVGLSNASKTYLDMKKLKEMSNSEAIYFTIHELYHSIDKTGEHLLQIKDYIATMINIGDISSDDKKIAHIKWLSETGYLKSIQWTYFVPVKNSFNQEFVINDELFKMYWDDYLELPNNKNILSMEEFSELFLFIVHSYTDAMYKYIREFRAIKAAILFSEISCFGVPLTLSEMKNSDYDILKLVKYKYFSENKKKRKILYLLSDIVFERLLGDINSSCDFCDISQNVNNLCI